MSNPHTEYLANLAFRLWREGIALSDISAQLEVHEDTVSQWITVMGLRK